LKSKEGTNQEEEFTVKNLEEYDENFDESQFIQFIENQNI